MAFTNGTGNQENVNANVATASPDKAATDETQTQSEVLDREDVVLSGLGPNVEYVPVAHLEPNIKEHQVVLSTSISRLKKRRGKRGGKTKKEKRKLTKQKKKSKKSKTKKNLRKRLANRGQIQLTADAYAALENSSDVRNQTYQRLKSKVLEALGNTVQVREITTGQGLEALLAEEVELKQNSETPTPSAFNLVNLSTLIVRYLDWKHYMPRVKPFYAAKCNPDLPVLRTLRTCGCGFDCASSQEISKAIEIGCPVSEIIYANPCKGPLHIKFAKEKNVKMMTFDNESEIDKIHEIYPEAKLVLRILSDDSNSIMAFNSKFGASVEESRHLISYAKKLNMNVIGVSFHVGSACQVVDSYYNSLKLAKQVFDIGAENGYKFSLLDIGGGWPGVDTKTLNFPTIAKAVTGWLDELFGPEVEVIAEPGRYFATEITTLAASVIAVRERNTEEDGITHRYRDYYLGDGVYGSFNCTIFDHAILTPTALKKKESQNETNRSKSTLFGPTCDSLDVICKDVELPHLEIGDWVYFVNMGAYTNAAASSFNGFSPPESEYFVE